MRRREALGTIAGALGTLAGCPGQSAPPRERELTAAPVPAAERTATPAARGDCPALPADADRVICGVGPVELGADRREFVVDAGQQATKRLRFVLRNRREAPFHTAADGWVLARRQPGRWTVLDWGADDQPVTVRGGERYAWTLGVGGSVDTGPDQHDVVVPLATGRYAFAVGGAYTRGERLGAVATVTVVSGGSG